MKLFLCVSILSAIFQSTAIAADYTKNSDNQPTEKHIHIPFVHIDINKHADGTKDVDVRAPFTKVHNPAGDNNAQVKAPFYKSEHVVNIAPATVNKSTVSTSKTVTQTTSNKKLPNTQ